jgi:beta-galactosidase
MPFRPAIFCMLIALTTAQAAESHRFEIGPDAFLLDGKPIQLISGEMHYTRIPREYWRQRLRMARAMGLNAIATYCFWDVHEPKPGEFNFTGSADVAEFCRMAQQEGLLVILRPGPFICAEWDFGGLPAWLLKDHSLVVRSMDPTYQKYSQRYLKRLGNELAPLQITRGGPIIMVQVENELGQYDKKDNAYLAAVEQSVKSAGFEVPLFLADAQWAIPDGWPGDLFPGLNDGRGPRSIDFLRRYRPNGPFLVPEFYPGWLDLMGEPHLSDKPQYKNLDQVVPQYKWLIDHNVSVNLYMFHGGTNWGGMNGANLGKHYQPEPTSYDYDAPLDESGRPTAKYFAMREAILAHLGPAAAAVPAVPAVDPPITIPPIVLQESARLFDLLPKPVESEKVLSMEDLDQNFGWVLYRKELPQPAAGQLKLEGLRHYAQIFLNQNEIGSLDWRLSQNSLAIDAPAGTTLDVLVENMGRVNYGKDLVNNRTGITGSVTLDGKELRDWQIFSLPPFDDVSSIHFSPRLAPPPALYRGKFQMQSTGDTFLDFRAWTKGWVWVNGHNLGRYWKIGPQQTLYLPGVWLKRGENEIVVLEEEKIPQNPVVTGLDKPILDQLGN